MSETILYFFKVQGLEKLFMLNIGSKTDRILYSDPILHRCRRTDIRTWLYRLSSSRGSRI